MRISVRRAVESDWAFIFSTYLTNNWFSEENDTTLRKNTWMKIQHQMLEELLKKSPSGALVACLEEDVDFILGYVVLKDKQFSYIKKDFRTSDVNLKGILDKATDRATKGEL